MEGSSAQTNSNSSDNHSHFRDRWQAHENGEPGLLIEPTEQSDDVQPRLAAQIPDEGRRGSRIK
jgi:hypothetical protein